MTGAAPLRLAFFVVFAILPAVLPAAPPKDQESPLVRLTFQPELASGELGDERTVEGRIVAELEGGSLVFMDRGGRMWPVTPDRLKSREDTGQSFTPYSSDEMSRALREELGETFEIVTTKHYVLASEAGRDYARWAGMLFERLMSAFETHWNRRPLEYHEPEFPLCAIILRDKERFQEFALEDAGPGVLDALGYYSTLTNRMIMYDLTEGLAGSQPRNVTELNRRLAGQVSNVSTIVHEATHQIAFNSGLHTRLADNPFWLVEGMAMYFETPDLKSSAGWRTVGQLNEMRMRNYRDYLQSRRKPGAIHEMLSVDEQFHSANTALDVYSEAWALSYYLIRTKRNRYIDYLATIAAKPALEKDEPEERIAEFEAAFGPIDELEPVFMKWILRQQRR